MAFKVGDKVKFLPFDKILSIDIGGYYTDDFSAYGISKREIKEIINEEHTIKKIYSSIMRNSKYFDLILNEAGGYSWPSEWFKKANKQIEFDF